MNKLKIKLVKSLIGRLPKHIDMVHQLGLRKINREVIQPDNPAIRGLIRQVAYLLDVKDAV